MFIKAEIYLETRGNIEDTVLILLNCFKKIKAL
jgi:hypothetical protein